MTDRGYEKKLTGNLFHLDIKRIFGCLGINDIIINSHANNSIVKKYIQVLVFGLKWWHISAKAVFTKCEFLKLALPVHPGRWYRQLGKICEKSLAEIAYVAFIYFDSNTLDIIHFAVKADLAARRWSYKHHNKFTSWAFIIRFGHDFSYFAKTKKVPSQNRAKKEILLIKPDLGC